MNEALVKLKRNFGLTLILAIGLGVEFTNFQSMFFRFMLQYRPDWGAINHVPAMFLSAFLLLCIVIYGIRKQVVLSWFLALLTCIVSFTVYSRMELSWEWEKMDELNFVVLVLSAMLPMLVAYSTHQIAHDEEEDMNEMMVDMERKKRRQMQTEIMRQKELQYAQERKRMRAALAQSLREEEKLKMKDLYTQREGFASAYPLDEEDEIPLYHKAKYNDVQEDLTQKFVQSKQYNSANFAPIREKSSKNDTHKQPENKVITKVEPKKEYKDANNKEIKSQEWKNQYAQTESKLKTTPKINAFLEDEEVIETKVIPSTKKENLAKRFMQEIENEAEREVVFNVAPKKETTFKPVMSEESYPIRVAGGYKIACVHCGKETVKKSKTAKYCSTACRVTHNKQSGIEDDGKNPAFYLVKDDFDNSGVIEWANSESM